MEKLSNLLELNVQRIFSEKCSWCIFYIIKKPQNKLRDKLNRNNPHLVTRRTSFLIMVDEDEDGELNYAPTFPTRD